MSGHDYNPQHDAYLSGAPRHDELHDHWNRPDALDLNPLSLLTGRDWLKIASFIAALIVAVTLAVTAYGHGITTSDRPAICHNLTPADCVAMVQEAR